MNREERAQAPVLREALLTGRELAQKGENSPAQIIKAIREIIDKAPLARIDYIDVVDAENLQPIEAVQPNTLLALAAFFGHTRLIDNIRLA